jgi:hypothetical protein
LSALLYTWAVKDESSTPPNLLELSLRDLGPMDAALLEGRQTELSAGGVTTNIFLNVISGLFQALPLGDVVRTYAGRALSEVNRKTIENLYKWSRKDVLRLADFVERLPAV